MHYELPIGAFLSAIIALVPLPWHWRAGNVPTLTIIAWLFYSNIMLGVNSILWAGNIETKALVWCDIATKSQIGAGMALPACCLCLCIQLERIASVRQVRTSTEEKRRRMYLEIALCWGLPVLSMALHYIVQGHRFDIVQEFGCRPSIYVSLAAIFLVYVPPLTVVLLTLCFATVALYHFFRRRLTFARHLADKNAALTPSRYFRLMAMSLVMMLWTTFITVTNMLLTINMPLRPWISWQNVHSNFSRVGVFPHVFIPATTWRWTFFVFWSIPITTILFFSFFAFGQEAMKEYRACFTAVRHLIQVPYTKKHPEGLPSVARFPHTERKMFVVSDFNPHATDMATNTTKSVCDDIPLTPHSTTSFSTCAPSYDSVSIPDKLAPHFSDEGHISRMA